jgi:hypothetical protein
MSFSDLAVDPRLDRQIAALSTRHAVVAAGLAPSSRAGVEFVDLSTAPRSAAGRALGLVRRLVRRHDAVFWGHPENQEVLRRLARIPADVVVVNDLRGLPIALRLGVPVVFDAHEYATEELSNEIWWRLLIRPHIRWLSSRHLPAVAAMMTVGEGIAAAYERDVGVRAVVVTNAPPFADLGPREVSRPVRLLHHGLAQRGRGLEEMVEMAELLDERFTFDFVLVEASRGFRDELIRRAAGNPRIRFLPPVPMRELPRFANGYDVGVFLLPPNNLNRRFALPNKLFEFVQGRLAVAVGPSPEMAAVVRRYGCGVVAADFRPASLASVLNGLDDAAIMAFKRASDRAASELCAERNVERILNVVDVAVKSRAGAAAAAAK